MVIWVKFTHSSPSDYKESWVPKNWCFWTVVLEKTLESPLDCKIKPVNPRGRSQDGGGIGWGDHFLPHKFIKRSFECWTNATKQLLNSGRGHQAPRKAAYYLRKEVGQNIKDKKRDKRVRDRDPPWGGSRQREVSKHQETLSPAGLWGVLESQMAT